MKVALDFEQKLLLALSADELDASPFAQEARQPDQSVDWAAFRRLTKRHRVGGLVHANLHQLPALKVPSDVRLWLNDCAKRNAFDYMRSIHAASEIIAAFKADGIASSLLKGFSVAAQFYRRPGYRAMIDIDILVDAERYEDAERLLIKRGFKRLYPQFELDRRKRDTFYRLHNAFTFIRPTDGLQIDLHWRLISNPVPLMLIDSSWQGLVEWRNDTGRSLPTLNSATHFIYVMVHGAKHGWVRLKWLVDFDKMIRNLTNEQILEVAQLIDTHGLGNLAKGSFGLARFALGTPIPQALQAFEESKKSRRIANLQAGMLFVEEPAKPHRLSDWRYYFDRMRHSLLLHPGKTYRRHTLARELARPDDLAVISVAPQRWWLLAFLSPFMGVWRSFRAFAVNSK